VIFDANPAMTTNSVTDTLDALAPTSKVAALPASEDDKNFVVSWSGQDDTSGSGLASFAVYVSDNGGPSVAWLSDTTETSATYNGQPGHTYGFYSVATDNAGNVQAAPAAPDATVRVAPSLAISSIAAVSPNPRNTAVSSVDITFNEPINPGAIAAGALTLTDDGGPDLITSAFTVTSILGSTYRISGLAGLTTASGSYTLTVDSAAFQDQDGGIGSNSVAASWLMDTTAPSSHVVNSLGTSQTSDFYSVAVTFTDPAGPGGAPASGISSIDLYDSVNNGRFSKYQTITLTAPEATGTVTFSFVGQDRNVYAFHSVAHDAAANIENKSSTAIEASTSVPDLNPPVTHILTSSPAYVWNPFPSSRFSGLVPSSYANGIFTLNWAGADPDQNTGVPTGSIVLVDIYVTVDASTTPTLIGQLNAGTPNGAGVYSGSLTYDALADGQAHTYRFFSIGVDDQQKKQMQPGSADVTFSNIAVSAPLAVQNLVVENNIAERSFIEVLDVDFNQSEATSTVLQSLASGLVGSSRNSYVELVWYGENLTGVSQPRGSVNLFNNGSATSVTLNGNDLSINFGPNGVTSLLTETGASGTGKPNTTFGDGWYALGIDPSGDPSQGPVFWVTFIRLLGDTNGDGVVTGPYTTKNTDASDVYTALGQSGLGLDPDVDGSGAVNSKDLAYAVAARGDAVGATAPSSFPQFQLFAGAPATGSAVAITEAEVQSLVPEALAAWMTAGLDAADLRRLESVHIEVANLGTSILGLEATDVVTINQTAAGYNWYMGTGTASVPIFSLAGAGGETRAVAGSRAAGRVDLLTVLEHELGHVIGLADNSQAGDLMDIALGLGVRRAPTRADLATIARASITRVAARVFEPVVPAIVSENSGGPAGATMEALSPSLPVPPADSRRRQSSRSSWLDSHSIVDAALAAIGSATEVDGDNKAPSTIDVFASKSAGRFSRRLRHLVEPFHVREVAPT
jgi:hypothetical protein